jgi:hypothetical protein
LVVIELVVGVFIGFALGYGIREFISQRRHAAAREHFLAQVAAEHEERPLSQQQHIDRMKLMAASVRAVVKSNRRSV